MFNLINHITAVLKVGRDKTLDYITYYAKYILDDNESNSDDNILMLSNIEQEMLDTIKNDIHLKNLKVPNNIDYIDDYSDIINVEKLTDETNNKRIFKSENILTEYIYFFSKPTHIIDNIYLGSAFNAASYYDLKELNIRSIINVTKEISQYYPDDFTYLNYNIYDNNKDSISDLLEDAYNNILHLQATSDGNILIHCYMGSSRSASLVLYYLMKSTTNDNGELMSHEEALEFLKSKRKIVNPTFRLTKDLAKSIILN